MQGLTAVDVTDDSSLIAGGFADSTVRVWSVTPKKLRSVKQASGKIKDINLPLAHINIHSMEYIQEIVIFVAIH